MTKGLVTYSRSCKLPSLRLHYRDPTFESCMQMAAASFRPTQILTQDLRLAGCNAVNHKSSMLAFLHRGSNVVLNVCLQSFNRDTEGNASRHSCSILSNG